MRVYHFSEDPAIRSFAPHVAATSASREAYVWAIDAWHSPMYYTPRDCPRACFWAGPKTSDPDRERWLGPVQARMVIAIESSWLDRLRATELHRYSFDARHFTPHDATAGHFVSRETLTPLAVEPVGDLLRALAAADVELRITPSLIRLWEQVIRSTLAYSGTRLRNAIGWETLRLPEP